MHKLVLLRHGQSTWNLENRFTGWIDVDLSARGEQEAQEAGRLLRDTGIEFDLAVTSLLKRAIRTLWIALEELDCVWLPVELDWRINERHYGALQGLDKRETVARHGAEQVRRWRRGYAVRPPDLPHDDPTHPRFDRRYAGIAGLPSAESLADTLVRVARCWDELIAPRLRAGRTPLVVAHGNSLRALMKHLEGLSDDAIMSVDVPTGIPLVYRLDAALRPQGRDYLGDPARLQSAVAEVQRQTAAAPR